MSEDVNQRRGGLTPVTVNRPVEYGGPIALYGEGSGHPDLVITPTVSALNINDAAGWYGWGITHVPSGHAMLAFPQEVPVDFVRVAAWMLADSGIDWSRSPEDLVADDVVKDAVEQARERANIDWVNGTAGYDA